LLLKDFGVADVADAARLLTGGRALMALILLHRGLRPVTTSQLLQHVWGKVVETDETHGAGVTIAVDPVGAVVRVKVLAPVLVETAAARHGEVFRECGV
jgi:hypothetical protein